MNYRLGVLAVAAVLSGCATASPGPSNHRPASTDISRLIRVCIYDRSIPTCLAPGEGPGFLFQADKNATITIELDDRGVAQSSVPLASFQISAEYIGDPPRPIPVENYAVSPSTDASNWQVPRPGRLHLLRQNLKHGDIIEVKVVAKSTGGASDQHSFNVHITDYHWGLRLAPALVFVNRIRRASRADATTSSSLFKPAASASLLIGGRYDSFWKNMVIPTVNLNAAAVDFRQEPTMELGMGVGLGFLGNNLVLGAGNNLNEAGAEAWYFFMGVNFLESIDAFKGYFNGHPQAPGNSRFDAKQGAEKPN